jgi:hypothetical protein
MKVWIDNIELPKVDISGKDTAGREFLRSGEMVVHYTAYKSGNHTWQGEFTCSFYNEINLEGLAKRISTDIEKDTATIKGEDLIHRLDSRKHDNHNPIE